MKCQKGPPPERIVKTTVTAGSPDDTCHLPPRSEAARFWTDSSTRAERGTEYGGPCRHRCRRHADVATCRHRCRRHADVATCRHRRRWHAPADRPAAAQSLDGADCEAADFEEMGRAESMLFWSQTSGNPASCSPPLFLYRMLRSGCSLLLSFFDASLLSLSLFH